MSEYEDSLQHSQVVKDAVSINAAEECERLAEENRYMRKRCIAIAARVDDVMEEVRDLYNYVRTGV